MLVLNCFKRIFIHVVKTFNYLLPKCSNSIFIIPHHNCRTDRYDIINYKSDNALCLVNYIIRNRAFNNFSITLVVDDCSKIEQYKAYAKTVNEKLKIEFVKRNKYCFEYIKRFCKSKYILSTTEYELFPYRIQKQCVSCLGYFTPFKNDFIYKSEEQFRRISKRNNRAYDLYFTTSVLASRILSSDSGLYYSKFRNFGFPRNDIFYNAVKETGICEQFSLEFGRYDRIITYTPTFRDYESNSNSEKRGLFGYDDKSITELIKVLEKHNAVLVVKLHPFQNKSIVESIDSPFIRLYNSYQGAYSLYDLLSQTEVLITDYTSTVFDFFHVNRPVIFYFYDKKEYEQSRGFALEPIESLCPGPITNNVSDLANILDYILSGNDDYVQNREEVSKLVNNYRDGNSAKRICDYLFRNN